jgi:hypothetical protein
VVAIAQALSGPKIIEPPAASAVTAMPLVRRNALRRSPILSNAPSLRFFICRDYSTSFE